MNGANVVAEVIVANVFSDRVATNFKKFCLASPSWMRYSCNPSPEMSSKSMIKNCVVERQTTVACLSVALKSASLYKKNSIE